MLPREWLTRRIDQYQPSAPPSSRLARPNVRFGSLGDLHESLLDELCRSCHGIRIDLDVRQQVLVSPAMGLCGRAAKLDLHAALLQVGYEILVGVARRDVAICVICRVVQSHMPGIRMEDCDDLRGRAPARDVV